MQEAPSEAQTALWKKRYMARLETKTAFGKNNVTN